MEWLFPGLKLHHSWPLLEIDSNILLLDKTMINKSQSPKIMFNERKIRLVCVQNVKQRFLNFNEDFLISCVLLKFLSYVERPFIELFIEPNLHAWYYINYLNQFKSIILLILTITLHSVIPILQLRKLSLNVFITFSNLNVQQSWKRIQIWPKL